MGVSRAANANEVRGIAREALKKAGLRRRRLGRLERWRESRELVRKVTDAGDARVRRRAQGRELRRVDAEIVQRGDFSGEGLAAADELHEAGRDDAFRMGGRQSIGALVGERTRLLGARVHFRSRERRLDLAELLLDRVERSELFFQRADLVLDRSKIWRFSLPATGRRDGARRKGLAQVAQGRISSGARLRGGAFIRGEAVLQRRER